MALVSLAAFLGFGCYLEYTISQSDKQLTVQASKVLIDTDGVLNQVKTSTVSIDNSLSRVPNQLSEVTGNINNTLALVNRICLPGPCGILADVSKTLNTVRGTFGQIEVAANHEDRNLTTLDSQESQLFVDTHTTLTGFIPIQTGLSKTIFDADSLITSPDLIGTLHNFNTTTYNIGQTTGDFQSKFHAFLYPPICKGFKCHIGQDINDVRIGSQFAEPAYWAYQLFKARP